ncbi:unnamed protein product [Nippostrongylus brasiliensis]|uniref:Recep_L_domain domain-containing protein n=1 Tax=Nippostrongylus brasiliensis TaxID=27835 RepID=A0A0N4YGL6_NIPBR|nr:unnamed protein product [Nippostrongylus brasiliensis]
MCLNISDTDIETVSLSATAIDGKCKGPQVTIMNNKRLTDVEFGKKLLQGFAKAKGKRISIHGNPKLKARTIKKLSKYKFVDVQQHTSVIKNNPQLCLVEELDFLQERFRNLTIMHNRKDCENDCLGGEVTEAYLADIENDCLGGEVTEAYLADIGRCTIIHGDVLIRNWKEKPVYVDLLHKIKKISGKLIIEDNENLGEFDYFSGLEVVRGKGGVHKHDKGNQPAAAMETSESHSIVKWIGVAVTVAILLIVIIAVVIVVVVLLTRRKAKSTISLEPATLDGESKKVLDGLVEVC